MICPHCQQELILNLSKPVSETPFDMPEITEDHVVTTEQRVRDIYPEKQYYHKRPVGNTLPFIEFRGNKDCAWMSTNALQTIAVVAESIAKPLIVLDCSPISGQCPGHPLGSHCNLLDCDIRYYQSGNIFDWETTFLFLYRLRQIAPEATCMVHSELVARMRTGVSAKYGADVFDRFSIIENDGYNHDTHAHLSINGPINYDFKLSDFLQRG